MTARLLVDQLVRQLVCAVALCNALHKVDVLMGLEGFDSCFEERIRLLEVRNGCELGSRCAVEVDSSSLVRHGVVAILR